MSCICLKLWAIDRMQPLVKSCAPDLDPQLPPMYIPAVIMIAISLEMKVMYNAQNQYTKFRLQSTFM